MYVVKYIIADFLKTIQPYIFIIELLNARSVFLNE